MPTAAPAAALARPALAIALGGASDIIGALALARSLGFKSVVLVQPGSPAQGASSAFQLHKVEAQAAEEPAPGGAFYDNDSMIAYLASRDADIRGYYLTQPKDDGNGFSATALAETTSALTELIATYRCSAIVGIDFGCDVAKPHTAGGPYIMQRDMLNLRAAGAAAKAGIAAHLFGASPGIDAAAVAPEYAVRAAQMPPPRVLEMSQQGILTELPGATPPECALPLLPAALFKHRTMSEAETAFHTELATLDARIMADAPADKRAEHASKTYHTLASVWNATQSGGKAASDFVAIGQLRGAEQARAHLHSSFAIGLYDLGYLLMST